MQAFRKINPLLGKNFFTSSYFTRVFIILATFESSRTRTEDSSFILDRVGPG